SGSCTLQQVDPANSNAPVGDPISPDEDSEAFNDDGTWSADFTVPVDPKGKPTTYVLTVSLADQNGDPDGADKVMFKVEPTPPDGRPKTGAKQGQSGRRSEGARAAPKG